jgi:hypothetical protein
MPSWIGYTDEVWVGSRTVKEPSHIFAKRSAKIDKRDIRIAQERWEDFRARMDAQPRVPPRAAGHDAP